MSIVVEFISKLLNEYEDILSQNPDLRTQPCPNNEFTRLIKKSLEDIHNVKDAIRWWEETSRNELTLNDRRYHLYLLLQKLDHIFSDKSIVRYKTTQDEYIAVGRRWWNHYARCIGNKGPLDGSPLSIYSGFPHLRYIKCEEEEWLKSKEIDRAFEPVKRKGYLRIGLCALSGEAITQFVGTKVVDLARGIYGFRASYIKYSAKDSVNSANTGQDLDYVKELLECIKWARDSKINILCFPELSICMEGREFLRSEIKKDYGHLCLIIPGSYHESVVDSVDIWVNTAPIWLVTKDGITESAKFEKTEPFSMKVSKAIKTPCIFSAAKDAEENGCSDLREDIRPGELIRVLETPVGTFGVLICKDQLTRAELIQRYATLIDHLLVVSMNSSPSAWFWSESEKVARDCAVATFYVNAAQVVEPENSDIEMAFWNIPNRLPKDNRNSDKEKYYRKRPTGQRNRYIKLHKLPQSGRVYFEVKIPRGLLYP